MGAYILGWIILMTVAAAVVTQDPEENSEFTKPKPKGSGGRAISRGPGKSWTATSGFTQK